MIGKNEQLYTVLVPVAWKRSIQGHSQCLALAVSRKSGSLLLNTHPHIANKSMSFFATEKAIS